MPERKITLALLRTIAEANGTDIDFFVLPPHMTESAGGSPLRRGYRRAAMLPRLFRAYFALPGMENRLRALRMIEAMAARAQRRGGDTGP
ncbi:hypothetical protein MKK69_19195 [Methylobacterium sp. J-026]|uniref:hypothetical protein n=1 Tax=Methylobacterium sp. J-026 TaxID=2836624 RepID=UPI001FBA8D4D|nr:hypothetical protein [Methylobacterium sp. J-026]MCJ2136149.1 hypothetical protein [Methylobacterium sp. J-026]